MTPQRKAAALLALAIGASLVAVLSTQQGSRSSLSFSFGDPAPLAESAARGNSSEAVLGIAPGVKRAKPMAAAAIGSVSPLIREFRESRDHKALHDRLKAAPARTAEESFVLAEILERCAEITDRKKQPGDGKLRLGGEGSRERFAASLSPRAPARGKRIAAFEEINFDACAGLSGVVTTEAEIRGLLEAAAAGGDIKARVALVRKDLESQRRAPDGQLDWSKPVSVTDAQLEVLRQGVASGQPHALQEAVNLLAWGAANFHLRGPDEAPIDSMALYQAAALIACDQGARCGADSPMLLQACAFEGHCDAADYRDYLFYYGSAPGSSQRVAEYQARLSQAVRDNDWSYFQFHRGQSPWAAAFQKPTP